MPIYEYRCTRCGHCYEVIQKMTDRPHRKCPECAGSVEKLVSRTSFQLKGGGWYINDYSKSAAPDSKKTAKKNDASKADTGSGSKKASKAKSASKD